MVELDRAGLVAALAKLSDPDDDAAVAAARDAAGIVADAGLDWADLIVPQDALTALTESAEVPVESDAAAEIDEAATNEDAIVLIDRLLDRKNLYEGTREELLAYKQDIADGTFEPDDLAYLNALYARITMNKVRAED